MRFGQVLALRRDLLSYNYADELLKVLNYAEPLPYSEIRKVFMEEKDSAPENFFAEFDNHPIASTPSAQVYKAVLKDGKKVAVKIQRPDAKKTFENDFGVMLFMSFIADFFHLFSGTCAQEAVIEFICWARCELDFLVECKNAYILRKHSSEHPRTVIPEQFVELSSGKIIIQEFIESGVFVSDLMREKREDIAVEKLSYYVFFDIMRQYFIDGFFHADPHPANIIFLPGEKAAYLDFGVMGKAGKDYLLYAKILYGTAVGDPNFIAENLFSFQWKLIGADMAGYLGRTRKEKEKFEHIAGKIKEKIAEDVKKDIEAVLLKDKALVLQKIQNIGKKYSIYFPKEVVMHLRTINALNAVFLEVVPGFDISKALGHFFERYPLEKIEEVRSGGGHEEVGEELVGFDEKAEWRSFREILVLEKERKLAAKEKFAEMIEYYSEKYKDLRSSIKQIK